jgi:hypothetical protein
MKNFKTATRGNSRDTSDTSSDASLPFLEAMSMDPDKDMLDLPAEAELGGPKMLPAPPLRGT